MNFLTEQIKEKLLEDVEDLVNKEVAAFEMSIRNKIEAIVNGITIECVQKSNNNTFEVSILFKDKGGK